MLTILNINEEENPGYLRVLAVFAGAHVMRAFFS